MKSKNGKREKEITEKKDKKRVKERRGRGNER